MDKAIFSNLSSSFINLNESSIKDESLHESLLSEPIDFSFVSKSNQENLNTSNAPLSKSMIEERPQKARTSLIPRPRNLFLLTLIHSSASVNSNKKQLGISAIGKPTTRSTKVRMSLLPQPNQIAKTTASVPARRGASLLPKEIRDGLSEQ